jgi:sugar phosphate isomerase/epimerase
LRGRFSIASNQSEAVMNSLSLAAGVLPEFGADVVADAAGEAGYPFAGFTIDPEIWDAAMTSRVRRRVDAHGIGVLDVEVVWIPAGGELDDDHKLIIDVGAELGARNLLVVSRERDVARNAAALHRLCERAAPAGMRVALEFLMIAKIRSLSAAHAIVEACDHPAAAILVDTLHLQRAGEGVEALESIDARLFPYAQFCDGHLACSDNFEAYLEDAMDLRSAAGEGELPLRQVLEVLPADCPLSLEVRSKRYREAFPRPTDRARTILQQTQSFLATG